MANFIQEIEELATIGGEIQALANNPAVKAELPILVAAIGDVMAKLAASKMSVMALEAEAVKVYGMAAPELQAVLEKLVPGLAVKPELNINK